jgi:hypothetical protein
MMMMESTAFEFTLPKGLLDDSGNIHQQGMMRLATGHDEIYVSKHPKLRENPAYAMLVMLSRTIDELGTLSTVTPEQLEQLFLIDLLYLRDFFHQIHQSAEVAGSGEF